LATTFFAVLFFAGATFFAAIVTPPGWCAEGNEGGSVCSSDDVVGRTDDVVGRGDDVVG
jgi:hypothetical protein